MAHARKRTGQLDASVFTGVVPSTLAEQSIIQEAVRGADDVEPINMLRSRHLSTGVGHGYAPGVVLVASTALHTPLLRIKNTQTNPMKNCCDK